VFESAAEQRRPESEGKFRDDVRRIGRLREPAEALFCRANLFRESPIEAEETRLIGPVGSEQYVQFAVTGVAQPHLDGLQRCIEGRADARIPFVERDGVPPSPFAAAR